jgi:uncharacterized protein (TIGR03067 family)
MTQRQDLELLQGSWTVTALEVNGEPMGEEMLRGARIVVKGNRFISTGMGAVYEGRLELNASASPRKLDMKFDEGPEKGNTNFCIYRLEGDTWKLCIATHGAVRPDKFASTRGSGFAVETLIRGDAAVARKRKARSQKAAPTNTSTAEATEFEGDWQMVSGIMGGKPMDQSLVKWVKRVTRGNQTTVVAGPNEMLKVEFTSDPSKEPKTIDYVNLAGSNRGKIQLGIYEFEDDLLRVFIAAPGKARPSQFERAPGKGSTLTVWKRV